MNTSSGWFAFVRARDHPLSSKSIGHRIKPCRHPIFDLSSEDVIARRRKAERIEASRTPLSVRSRPAHICLIKRVRQRSCGDYSTPEIQRLSAGSSRCCQDAAMIVDVWAQIQTAVATGGMTSAAIPNTGGTMTVLPRFPEVTVAERLFIYRALWHESGLLRVVRGGSASEMEPCRLSCHACHTTET
jgi:hypothetical protein